MPRSIKKEKHSFKWPYESREQLKVEYEHGDTSRQVEQPPCRQALLYGLGFRPDYLSPRIQEPSIPLVHVGDMIAIPTDLLLEKFSSRVERYCDIISLSSLRDECKKWTIAVEVTAHLPQDSMCLILQLVACTLQQSPCEDMSSIAYQEAADDADVLYEPSSSFAILQRRVYACFWFRCEGQLRECREAISKAYQQALHINLRVDPLHSNQYNETAKRIWYYLIAWDQELAILLKQPKIIDTSYYLIPFESIELVTSVCSRTRIDEQPFNHYYNRVLKSSWILCPTTDDVILPCITLLQDLEALVSLLEREKLQMHLFAYYIFDATSILCGSIRKRGIQISAQKVILWAVQILSSSNTPVALAEVARQCNFASFLDAQNYSTMTPEDNTKHPAAQGPQVTETQLDDDGIMELDKTSISKHAEQLPRGIICSQSSAKVSDSSSSMKSHSPNSIASSSHGQQGGRSRTESNATHSIDSLPLNIAQREAAPQASTDPIIERSVAHYVKTLHYKITYKLSCNEGTAFLLQNDYYFTSPVHTHLKYGIINCDSNTLHIGATSISLARARTRLCDSHLDKYNILHLTAEFSQDIAINHHPQLITCRKTGSTTNPGLLSEEVRGRQYRIAVNPNECRNSILVFRSNAEYVVSPLVDQIWCREQEQEVARLMKLGKSHALIYQHFDRAFSSIVKEDLRWFSGTGGNDVSRREKQTILSNWLRIEQTKGNNDLVLHWRRDRDNWGNEFRGESFSTVKSCIAGHPDKERMKLHFH